MKRIVGAVMATLIILAGGDVAASELNYSGKSDILDGTFLAYGFNPKTKVLSGYIAAFRTSPGRTDECKLVFAGTSDSAKNLSVSYLGEEEPVNEQDRTRSRASLVSSNNQFFLEFVKDSLEADCHWILPFNLESDESEKTGKVLVAMRVPHAGRWIGVYAIRAERARFHSRPDSTAVQKAFVVRGDIVYVYDERPDWYFVEYEGDKKKTRGWIRKSDTLQP